MDMQTFMVAANIAIITWLLPVIFLGFGRQPPVFSWLIACLLFSFITEITARILFSLKISPNYAANVYLLFCVVGFSYFFYNAIKWTRLKKPLVYFNVAYFIFACWNFLQVQKVGPNSYSMLISSFFILVLCILFFYKIVRDLPHENVYREPLFVIISGFFVSYSGKVVLTGVMHYFITQLKDNMFLMAILYNALTILGNLIIAFGAYLQFKRSMLEGRNAM